MAFFFITATCVSSEDKRKQQLLLHAQFHKSFVWKEIMEKNLTNYTFVLPLFWTQQWIFKILKCCKKCEQSNDIWIFAPKIIMSSVEKLESEKLFSYRKSFISIFQMSLRFPRGLLFVRRTLFQKSNFCPKIQFWQKLYFQAYLNFSAQNWKIFFKKFRKLEFSDHRVEVWNSVFSVFLCCQGSLISLEFNYPRHIFLPFPSMSWSRRIDTKKEAKEAKQLHATLDRQNPWGMSADLSTSNLEKNPPVTLSSPPRKWFGSRVMMLVCFKYKG